jgi:hypothetical protein
VRCKNLGNGAIFDASGGPNWGRKNSVAIAREFLRGVAIRTAARGKSGVFAGAQTVFTADEETDFFSEMGPAKNF